MALIKQIKAVEKSFIKINTTKVLADEFNKLLEMYNKSNVAGVALDFDNLVKKLNDELSKINTASSQDDANSSDKFEIQN